MCFPFLFRATLDTRSTVINEEMKMAAAKALAELALEPIPDEVKRASPGRTFEHGRDYVIPSPFDPRLMVKLSVPIAQAAMDSGAATISIQEGFGSMEGYKAYL